MPSTDVLFFSSHPYSAATLSWKLLRPKYREFGLEFADLPSGTILGY